MKCTLCGVDIVLQSSDDKPKYISGEPVCDDCYYDGLGKTIEQHPIGSPRVE